MYPTLSSTTELHSLTLSPTIVAHTLPSPRLMYPSYCIPYSPFFPATVSHTLPQYPILTLSSATVSHTLPLTKLWNLTLSLFPTECIPFLTLSPASLSHTLSSLPHSQLSPTTMIPHSLLLPHLLYPTLSPFYSHCIV
jgi:hypothetical protein